MERSRVARKGRHRERRRRAITAVGAALAVLAVAAALFTIGTTSPRRAASGDDVRLTAAPETAEVTSVAATTTVPIEVPDVLGKSLDEAQFVLSMAGFIAKPSQAATAQGAPGGTVLTQDPPGGTQVEPGAEILLSYAPVPVTETPPARSFVVCIDPGHQSRSDLKLEPIGPGSTEMKERVKGGATGQVTRVPEYETVLAISLKVQRLLQARGVQVVMTRTSNDVDISNAERAEIANKAGADVFVRIHADSALDSKVSGVSTLYPAKNAWTGPIVDRSSDVAKSVHAAVVSATGAVDRGAVERADITGFNWSKVPTLLVETGFLSNPVEDRLLNSASYQDKVAAGIADGLMDYLEE